MAPRSEAFKRIRQRLRRSLRYGNTRMDCLTIQISELVANYFDRCSIPNQFFDLDFAARVSYNSFLDPCTLVAAMIYIERLRRRNPTAFAQSNPNDLYLSAIMLATKFLNDCGLDDFIWNDEWAEIAKTDMRYLNQLELRLLDNLQWDTMITLEQFDIAINSMERGIALSSVKSSGFFSYTDINTLATDLTSYMSHVRRFIVMSLAVASTYFIFCTLSWSLLLSVQKTVEVARAKMEADFSGASPQELTVDTVDLTVDDCVRDWIPTNESLNCNYTNEMLLKPGSYKLLSRADFMIASQGHLDYITGKPQCLTTYSQEFVQASTNSFINRLVYPVRVAS